MFLRIIFVYVTVIFTIVFSSHLAWTKESSDKCFCQLSGMIDDCFCDIKTLENFNNDRVYPLLSRLVERDFFRYYKVNLFKSCFLWNGDVGLCGSENCGVKICSENELPIGMRPANFNKFIEKNDDCVKSPDLGHVNSTLSNITMASLSRWDRHDDMEQNFCDLDDDNSLDLGYVDLVNNPERYTGYKGPLAWRIWKAIYEENCFPPDSITKHSNPLVGVYVREEPTKASDFFHSLHSGENLQGMCLEKRVFYRVISGLHSSINIHLCAEYLFKDGWGEEFWGPNLAEFQRRFDPDQTKGEGTQRLKNLYFIYLLELRALSKVAPYFAKDEIFLFTGKPESDEKTKKMLIDLLALTTKFPMHFDEGVLFQDKTSKGLKREFRERFRNITRIIDCVTCEKCRLWGKLQTQGLGTALKILFSGDGQLSSSFRLQRQEIVSLVNAFSKISHSIKKLQVFKEQLGCRLSKSISKLNMFRDMLRENEADDVLEKDDFKNKDEL